MVDALTAFPGLPPDQWLPQAHPAKTGQFLKADGKPHTHFTSFRNAFSDDEIIEVLAATAPHHCMDGWAYLSRAFASLLAGDAHATRHLAYYAQLRAALAILHSHGVGIFNSINFAVDRSGQIRRLDDNQGRGAGTHIAAWELLENWSAEPDVARAFMECIQFRRIPLSDCIDAIWPSSQSAPLVSAIIHAWGVDLRRSADEHGWRNVSSYCAHAFNPAASDFTPRLELLRDIWHCLEPDGRGGYPTLDRHLLRNLLDVMKRERVKTEVQRHRWLSGLEALHPEIRSLASPEFLNRSLDEFDLPVIAIAVDNPPGDVHAMVCRALLLLRTATSTVRTAFIDAGFEPLHASLRPWFDLIGAARGFWPLDEQPDNIEDLWDDVGFAVSDLSQRVFDLTDQFALLDSLPSQTIYLSQAERACMWGVCA